MNFFLKQNRLWILFFNLRLPCPCSQSNWKSISFKYLFLSKSENITTLGMSRSDFCCQFCFWLFGWLWLSNSPLDFSFCKCKMRDVGSMITQLSTSTRFLPKERGCTGSGYHSGEESEDLHSYLCSRFHQIWELGQSFNLPGPSFPHL